MKPEFVVFFELSRVTLIPPREKNLFSASSLGFEAEGDMMLRDRAGNEYGSLPLLMTYAVSCIASSPLGIARLWVSEDVAHERIDTWEEAERLLPDGWKHEVEFERMMNPFLVISSLTDSFERVTFFRHKDWRRDWKQSLFCQCQEPSITLPERVMANIRYAHTNNLTDAPHSVY